MLLQSDFSASSHSTPPSPNKSGHVRCSAVFGGYVLDPVSNHVGVCLKQIQNTESIFHTRERRTRQSLLQQVLEKIQKAYNKPSKPSDSANPTLYVQISNKCFTDWSSLSSGVKVDVVLSRPVPVAKKNIAGSSCPDQFTRLTPWSIENIQLRT